MANAHKFDVAICGSGSAGLLAAVSLAQAGINFCLLEKRDGPLAVGQADGVQCRTVEIFESLGLSEDLLRESYHVIDLAFWSDGDKKIVRDSTAPDTPPGLSHLPHVILNQARLNGLLLEKLASIAPKVPVFYGHEVTSVETQSEDEYCVQLQCKNGSEVKQINAKYVLVSDTIRRSLGIKMVGDSSDAVWGVIDFIPNTDFPDIRRKVTIHSKNGSIVIIPREGGELVRFYIQMPPGTAPAQVNSDGIIGKARSILEGYRLDVVKVIWWSAYTIGQRLASKFGTVENRILLAGDACHTHSPKAGQGMNVSLQDGHNIGWKLASVLRGKASPNILSTYIQERRMVASNLIDFDRRLTQLYLKSGKDQDQVSNEFTEYFLESARYMAGLTSRYTQSLLTDVESSDQDAASNVLVGMRCPSVQIIRYCDGKPVQLNKALSLDNRWRLIVFPGKVQLQEVKTKVESIGKFLTSETSPVAISRQSGEDIDVSIESLLVYSGSRYLVDVSKLPEVFAPIGGVHGIQDLYKVYTDEPQYDGSYGHAYRDLGIDLIKGAVIVVRPDQHVGLVLYPENIQRVEKFFNQFLIKQ